MWQPTFNRPFSAGIFVGLVVVTSSNYFIGGHLEAQRSPWESRVSSAEPRGHKNERKADFTRVKHRFAFVALPFAPVQHQISALVAGVEIWKA